MNTDDDIYMSLGNGNTFMDERDTSADVYGVLIECSNERMSKYKGHVFGIHATVGCFARFVEVELPNHNVLDNCITTSSVVSIHRGKVNVSILTANSKYTFRLV